MITTEGFNCHSSCRIVDCHFEDKSKQEAGGTAYKLSLL